MKKTLSLVLSVLMLMLSLTACASSKAENESSQKVDTSTPEASSVSSEVTEEAPEVINIAGLKGPTSIGMIKLMDDASNGIAAANYNFTVAGAADEITPKLIKGELDIAAVPANLASILYNNTEGKIKLLALNTLGVTYIVENGTNVSTIADLKGKTVYCTGKGSIPEYTLRHILKENGIDPDNDVTLEFKSEATEIVSLMQAQKDVIAMLPMPYVFVAAASVENYRIALSLNDEWNALDNGSNLVTGVIVARSEFVEKYPETVKSFISEYNLSAEYVNANVTDAAQLVEKFDIFKAAVAEKAIPKCNITSVIGEEMKASYSKFIEILFEQNPKSVGGKLPSDDFYYNY